MRTEIHLVGGESAVFEGEAVVKTTDLGVEITASDDEGTVRILYPWTRIEKVTQTGPEISSTYRA